MESVSCSRGGPDKCTDDSPALTLKLIGICTILVTGILGISIPLIGKNQRFLTTDGSLFFAMKAFAAGVILATGYVHMLSDGITALTDPCLSDSVWSKFPFSGFVAMIASLGTLMVEFVGTQFYERRQRKRQVRDEIVGPSERVTGEEEGGGRMHNPPHLSQGAHSAGEQEPEARHVVVAQILELGIVSHSVIIGLSLGVSQSPCTIRPLIAALSFHQFFEGFALGGCISQAQYKSCLAFTMACFFAITTPAGVGVGIAISSLYNRNSRKALVVEGMLDSVSAGILIYMALVDLIATDFLSKKMSCNFRLQVVSYFTLFLGATLMSLLAIWE